MKKSALLQDKLLVKHWRFANVLMSVGKKGAGKRISFALRKVCIHRINILCFFKFSFYIQFLRALHITEKVLAKCGLK